MTFSFRAKFSVVVTDNDKRVKITKLYQNIQSYPNKTKAESKIRKFITQGFCSPSEKINKVKGLYYFQ